MASDLKKNWYFVLGAAPTDDLQELKQKYQKLVLMVCAFFIYWLIDNFFHRRNLISLFDSKTSVLATIGLAADKGYLSAYKAVHGWLHFKTIIVDINIA